MTKSHQDSVRDFMEAVGQYDPKAPKVDVQNLTESDVKVAQLRLKLIVEELDEMFEAFLSTSAYSQYSPLFKSISSMIELLEKDDLDIDRVEVTDAIVDQDYINSGTGVWLDLPLEEAFKAVHANNLTKLDPITGKVNRREDGKIIKPIGYVPVDLKVVVDAHDSKE